MGSMLVGERNEDDLSEKEGTIRIIISANAPKFTSF